MTTFPLHIELHHGVTVVNDGRLPGGTKRRALTAMLFQPEVNTPVKVVYPGTVFGAAFLALAYAIGDLPWVAGVAVVPKRDNLTDEMAEAIAVGRGRFAFDYVTMGYYPKLRARAKQLAAEHGLRYLPCGIDCPEAVAAIAEAAGSVVVAEGYFDQVWSAASSGTITRGLQAANIGAEYHAVITGMKGGDYGRAIQHVHSDKQAFTQPAKLLPPFATYPTYDGKVWEYAERAAVRNPDKRILFWNVAATLKQRRRFGH